MEIRRLVLGELATNCYIISSGKEALVIDPAAEASAILSCLEKEDLDLCGILLTHGHFDHTGALYDIKEKTGAKVYIHELDAPMLGDNEKNLSCMTGDKQTQVEPDVLLSGGETIDFGEDPLFVMHTPGHSAGSVSYIADGCVFVGDLIFKGSIGRYDFGNYSDELDSIKKLLEAVPDSTLLLPGHGEETTADFEKKNNFYIRGLFD